MIILKRNSSGRVIEVQMETDDEIAAEGRIDELLDQGLSTIAACDLTAKDFPNIDPTFWAWYRDEI